MWWARRMSWAFRKGKPLSWAQTGRRSAECAQATCGADVTNSPDPASMTVTTDAAADNVGTTRVACSRHGHEEWSSGFCCGVSCGWFDGTDARLWLQHGGVAESLSTGSLAARVDGARGA